MSVRQLTPTPHTQVLAQLGLDIVRGEYAQLSILPGDGELMDRFRVSRTVIREVFKTLSAKGMILARSGVGTRVLQRQSWNWFDADILRWHIESGAGPDFLYFLSEMRLALEPEAAALAAKRRSESHMASLKQSVEKMAASRLSPSEFVDGDLSFHLIVAEASGNPFMRSVSALIEAALALTFAVSSPLPDRSLHEITVARHRAIYDAIERGDADSAQGAMRAVIREGMKRVAAAHGRRADTSADFSTTT